MNYLFITDLHLKVTPPRCRSDNFEETLFQKLGKIADQRSQIADPYWGGILCGGDLFDSAIRNVSFRLVHRFYEFIKTHRLLPWYHCLGQHDVWGHNLESYGMGPVGMLGFDSQFVVVNSFQDSVVTLPGCQTPLHAISLFDINDYTRKEFFARLAAASGIVMCHAPIANRDLPFPHIQAADVMVALKPNTLVLCGDWHEDFIFMYDEDHQMVVNPGSFARLTAKEFNRQVRALLVTTQAPRGWSMVEQILVETPEFEPIITRKAGEMEPMMDAFAQELGQYKAGDLSLDEVKEMLRRIAAESETPEEVIDRALSYLESNAEVVQN